MTHLRALIAAILLVWTPLSGALAHAMGSTLTHHHCDNVWHDHADMGGVVVQGDDCDSQAINLDASSCDDCQFTVAAIPVTTLELEHAEMPQFHVLPIATAQNTVVFALFRPPKA